MFRELAEEGNTIKQSFRYLAEDEQKKQIGDWVQKCISAMKKGCPNRRLQVIA
ncbi:hypothetical protein GJ688_17845 [Heliobacillus mobilis]|uniref:Uncharacterized protein n=1 Tax=Heliobacterium mobile TaxID=28064 RepID=A0A6I3SRW7_HELMO|nr:hypothetical protein [Heliobacterium mobile]MTV50797.1 hypothetical protein [Heliobacterium mobile]